MSQQELISPNKKYKLRFLDDGNLAIYKYNSDSAEFNLHSLLYSLTELWGFLVTEYKELKSDNPAMVSIVVLSSWRNVSENPPPREKKVLLYSPTTGIHTGYYNGHWCYDEYIVQKKDITHWMPSPEIPEQNVSTE